MATVLGTNETASDTWSGILTDAVVRCGRDSERKLYLYGISSNRCAKCQAKLQSGNNTCGSCNYTHKIICTLSIERV
ncbi:unnamed protein product [Peronospora belbahrii]|uniref:Phorbol-ester/DAG-type domain-containing protein n=1 Tax=Peronospora belbahrii TaxID=622444 RepID=A0ABN8CLN2_9STRA|nr:unnamed protein product [Peronospora belbahrii]